MNRAARNIFAFTIIELMVVIGIIVLVLALAVPVVRALEGNHSLEAAYNQVSASLVHAREIAIYNHAPAGVAFYKDPVTGQQELAFVEQEISIPQDQGVIAGITNDTNFYDIIPGEQIVSLPTGLGVQLLNAGEYYTNVGTLTPVDKFIGAGLVLFDENGQLDTQGQYWIASLPSTAPGQPLVSSNYPHMLADKWHMNLNNTPVGKFNRNTAAALTPGSGMAPWATNLVAPMQIKAPPPLYGQPGVCIYDKDAYAAQIKPSTVASTPQPFDDQTIGYASAFFISQANQTPQSNQIPLMTPSDKQAEESWLIQNGQVYVIKPNDGSLLRNP